MVSRLPEGGVPRRTYLDEANPKKDRVLALMGEPSETATEPGPDDELEAEGPEGPEGSEGPEGTESPEGGEEGEQPAGGGGWRFRRARPRWGGFDPFRRRRRRRRRRGRNRGPMPASEAGAPAEAGAPRSAPAPQNLPKVTVKGIVKLHGDHSGTLVSSETYFAERGDPFLPKFLVESEDLEDGLLVEAEAVARGPKGPMVQKIVLIEGMEPAEYRGKYVQFHKGVSVDPDRRLRMETAADEISGRVLDLVAPIGRGQRCLIVAPPKAGKLFLLKTMANAIAKTTRT